MEKSDLQRFRNECVAAHNFYRAGHGTPPLCWSTRLAESAQNWAEQLASSGSLRYSSEKDIGENLTCLWGSELNGQKVSRIWYEEGKYFDYNKPRVSSRTRSFCQVVWEGTRELGAGAAVTKHGKQIVVARYFPPVNKKDVARNVKKARSTRDNEPAYDTRWSRLYLGLKEFHEECLSAHNEYRLRHGAAPLHWSAELAWEAQQWAENLARSGDLRHNDDAVDVGENLAGMTGGELSGREATDMWYDEIEEYEFDSPGYSEDTSNFSQVVWVASDSFGVGRAMEGDLCVVVAFYEPPGNMEGSFGDNVLRMGSAIRERKSKEPKGFVPPLPDLESFRLECLVTHNYYRARHGSPPLVLSSVLTDEAQYWAERLLVTGAMEGLDNSRIGISVAVLDKGQVSGVKVSELWYKEILNYDFDSPGFSNETLDFSQLVWLSSRKLGVGKATGAEGVTVVVARYEPVGNIDGLFVHNVRRRGHERGSCEPMIFHVEYRYRVRADSKSTNSFLSWEHEDTQTFGEFEGDTIKTSDLDQFDENENIVHRADEQESSNTLTVSDHFNRLVWIDPNSPTLQRKGVGEETTQEADDDEPEDEGVDEEDEEEDARTAYEQENRTETGDLTCVTEEPLIYNEDAELEEADLFSDPEDDLYQHTCEIRRSLSLDSEGTEPETHRGHVLSKVSFFETFQQGFEMQSSSNSESSLRRSLIQEELEELASRPKRQSPHEEEEGEEEEIVEEEHECQLEFDDVFPAHREGDEEEAQVDDDIFDDEGEDEDESLVSVSDAEDFTDYDTRPEGLQDYEFEDNVCVTHEFMEEEPSPMEIFDVYDEDVSHQYADVTEEEDQPQSSTKNVFIPTNMSTATEFQKNENFKLCEDEPPDVMEHAPDSYSEERVETTEAVVEVTQTSFQRTLDPESCYMLTKQEDARMKELISKIGLLPVEDNEGASDDLSDFNETIEGKLLEDVINSRNDRELQDERTPIDEICEAFLRDNVESEIDFDALFERLEREATETEKENAIPETSTEPARTESPETVQVVLRDHQSERTAGMEQIGVDLELVSVDQLPAAELEKEQELEPDITLDYECKTSTPVDGESFIELVSENTIEEVRRDRRPESEMDVKELQIRVESPTGKEESQEEIPQDKIDAFREEQSCEAVLRDYDHERARVLEETGLELVHVSSDIIHPLEEPVAEPLEYDQAPKSSTVSELPEAAEHINAEVRGDVQSEINLEDMFRRLDEEDEKFPDETQEEITQDAFREEQSCEAVLRDYDHERVRVLEETGLELNLVPISSDITHPFEEPVVEPLEYDQVAKSSTASELPEVAENINSEVRRDVQSEINFEEMFRRLDEEDTTFADEATETDETQEEITQDKIDAFREEQSCEAVLRDYDQERVRILEETGLELVPVSPGITHSFEESVAEPLEYNLAPKSSTVSELPEVAENINAEVRRDVQSEINFEEMFRRLDEEDTTFADEATETQRLEETVKETSSNEETSRASLYVEEDGTVDEVVHCIPSSSEYISHESKQSEPTEEIIHEIKQAKARPASLYIEENKLVKQVAAETPSSPKHIAGESVNVERIEVVSEVKETREEKRASLIVDELNLVKEIDTEAPYSQHVAGEGDNTEPFEEITEQTLRDHEMRASLYMEEDTVVQEVTPEAPSSPRHLANECENIHPSEEDIEEIEQSVEEKRASLYLEEETTVDYVTADTPSSPLHIAGESSNSESVEEIYEQQFDEVEKPASLFVEEDSIVNEVAPDTPSSPKHIAGESQNVEPFEEIDEEPTEERKRASLFLEEDSLVDEVETDTPSSPKHIAGESLNHEPFEEIVEEPTEESKRASLFLEEDSLVDEIETDTPSSPKHIAGESQNVEPFEEVDEEPTEESKRASLFLEEDSLEDEVETDTPSSPKHIAGESQNVEPFEEVDEEPTEESKRASLFLEEDSLVDEVEIDTPSSPKHIVGESRNVEPFEEVDEEPTEESKRASLFLEEDSLVDEIETDTPSSPKHIAGESLNHEPFEEIVEEPTEESKRASLFLEEDSLVDEVETDTPSSPKHIAGESLNHEPFEEIVEEPTEESKRASLFLEEDSLVDEVETDTPSSPKHIAGESQNVEPFEEVDEEPTEERKRASLFLEEDSLVDEIESDTPSSPKHIAGESLNHEPFEEIVEEPTEESKRASLFLEEDSFVDEVETDTPSSPKHIAGESRNHESFEEIVEEPTEESKRASLFLEEDSFVDEVETDTPSSPKHIAGESQNEENFEQTDEEPTEESKRAVLFLDEDTLVDEVITDTPSSPKHIAGESRNHESFEEIVEEPTEESKRASLFLEEDILVDEVITDIPSSPKHLAGESVNIESFQEVVEVPNDENKRASLFLEEDSSGDEVKTATSSVPIHIAGEALSITAVEEIHEEATPDVEHAREFEESDDEVRYDYVSLENADQNNYVAGEITNSELLEVTDDDESPESDYGEQFEEFEGIYGTQRFTEPSQSAHIAGEIKNIDSHDEAMEEVWKVEESLEYEDSQEVVTTTDIYETSQPSFHVAGELSNIEPQEESSEEEKPEEEACAEEFEEAEVQATTVVLKSPQSLLSIAAAALELKIDAAQQEVTEVVETKTVIEQQYSEGEHAGVPVILVNIAGDISDSDEDNTYYVEEEPQDDHEIETERYEENEETVVSYPSEEQLVSQSHVAAEFAVSEFTLEIEDQRYFAEPFEESEEGSVSELMSECSSSPLHVSGELRDFQDYETIDEEYGSETYHAIPYEESDYVSERSVSKGLPSLYITEEFSPQEIYEENILNETSVMIETAHAYNEVEEPLETEKSLVISEPPLQTAAEFSDSDYNDGIEEDEDLSERDFLEEFEDMGGIVGREISLASPREPVSVASELISSGPQIAEEEDELSDEIDNAQTQDVWEIELEEGSQIVEAIEEKEFASEIHKFTVVSEKEQRVEIKSSYQVVESKETQHDERIFMTEQATQMEISHELEVLATKTTRQVSSVNSHGATEFASEEILYKAEKNGAGGILHEEVKIIQEVSFTPICQTSRHFETTDQLSESILEKEVKDQESEKFEKQLSEDETEVRLLKSEVMKYKAAEQQAPLENPHVTVERETTFVKSYIVHSATKDVQEIQEVLRQDDVLVILKDDEASLEEEESAGEQFEEEIDIMRIDEALSEEEFRGEGAVEEVDQRDKEEESEIREGDQETPFYEEEVEISEVQPIYEEELEIQKVEEQEEETSSETKDCTVQTPTFKEEVEVVAYECSSEAVKETLECEPVETTKLRAHSPEFEEELEVSAFEVLEEHAEEEEPSGHSAVFEEEVDISASREQDQDQVVLSEDEELNTTDDIEFSEQYVEEESFVHVETTTTQRQPLDLSQVDLYEEDESGSPRYYVELSSTESLEPAYEEVEDEALYTETYVRQGDPLEENLEEFILVRYGDEFDSSGEEDISDHREIYVIPEEENDSENNNVVESATDNLKAEKEPLPESFFEEGFENMGLEEIRESPEFEIDDSPEDELDEEEQRQLEEYERLESFVILEEKLSQVESDDDENSGFQGEEGDENVFHSDVHSSSEETLHEDELGETMTASSIRQAAVSTETESKEEERADDQISSEGKEEQKAQEDISQRVNEEPLQKLSKRSDISSDEGSEKGEEPEEPPEAPPEGKVYPESTDKKDEKTEQSLSSDSSGEQSVSSEGSLSSTPSVDMEGLDDFEQDCLVEHNLYRRQHRAKPLKWSDELAAGAKEWAEHLASANCLERCEEKKVGENLASAQGKELSGSEVVEMWYKEATDYNFEVPAFNAKCGNFTQVVWASSREFGVAKCVSDDGTQYVAAWYKPAGNIVGEFKNNVKPSRDSSSRLKRRRSSARRRSKSGAPPSTPAEREKFKTECVISHNYYRTFHNAPPLRWSPLLAAEAQNYAERLVKTDSLTHSGQKDRGENLAYTWDSPLSARGAVDMWYDEVQDYDYECPGYTSDTGHFTQLAWVGTEEFGMGMAVAPDGRNVVVGRYFPPGNTIGQFKENVRPRAIEGIP